MRLALLLGGPPVVLSLLGLGTLLTLATLRPVSRLAIAAERLAEGGDSTVPGIDRMDEVGSLARALGRWQAAEQAKREKDRSIRELSTPALQLRSGLLLIPLIGAIDPDRAQQFTEQLLDSVGRHRARVVVIDVTGVLALDSDVADHLVRTVESCRLMGATAVLTGISAENAETLTRIEVDLTGLLTAGDLEDGIRRADTMLIGGSTKPPTIRTGGKA
jgi:anti-anti-sigma regulatory factor/HAMP domain-containing protein